MKMKKLLTVAICLLVGVIFTTVDAQTTTKKELKEQNKVQKERDKGLEKQIRENALKDARKKAKELLKEGFKESTGAIPLDKQIEQAWKYQYELDENGNKLFIVATQTAIGGNYSAAKTQATSLAKVDIAGQIETEVNSLIENQVSNESLGAEEAQSIISTVSANKSLIQQNLGRTLPVVEISRTLANGNTEIRVTLAYNIKSAFEVVKKTVGVSLKEKSAKLANELDTILEKY